MWLSFFQGKVAFSVVSVALLTSVVVACAADKKECLETAMTQLELNQCAMSQLQVADDELNHVYRAILSKYADDPEFIEKLRDAQRAWLAFRDAELEARFPVENKQAEYGSVYPRCANLFLADRTHERIRHLREWLDGTEEGNVCAGSLQFKPAR